MSATLFPLQSDALSKLRHNLRTPVNHILGYAEMLVEELEESGENGSLEDLRAIVDEGQALLALINEALGPSKKQIDGADLLGLHRDLSGPVNLIQGRSRTLMRTDLGIDGARADVEKIRSAAVKLLDMAAEAAGLREPLPADSENGEAAAMPVTASNGTGEIAQLQQESTEIPRVFKTEPSEPERHELAHGRLLVVDDIEANRDVLARRLEREGYEIDKAEDGLKALEALQAGEFDLVLLDIMMPGLDGIEVLRRIKADPKMREIPVIMISALDEIRSVVKCLEMGAEDYLSKPFDPVLLRARIGASLEKKRLRDEQLRKTEQLERAVQEAETHRCVAESLLRNILPVQVADELSAKGTVDPKYFEDVTILFTDFVGFTRATEHLAAEDLVNALQQYFTAFDRIVIRYGLEKLKTIGDSYMLAGGLPLRTPSHPVDVVLAAFELVRAVEKLESEDAPLKVRVGIHTGPVIAGVVGIKKFAFDIWGDTVNFSSRMESSGAANRINISARTYSRVKDFFACEKRGMVLTKDSTEHEMYFVNGIHPKLIDDRQQSPPPAFLRRYSVYFQKEPPAFPKFLFEQ